MINESQKKLSVVVMEVLFCTANKKFKAINYLF